MDIAFGFGLALGVLAAQQAAARAEKGAGGGRGRMRVRIHLVVDHDKVGTVEPATRRVDLTTTIEAGSPFGQGPVIGAIRAVSDLTVSAVKEITR